MALLSVGLVSGYGTYWYFFFCWYSSYFAFAVVAAIICGRISSGCCFLWLALLFLLLADSQIDIGFNEVNILANIHMYIHTRLEHVDLYPHGERGMSSVALLPAVLNYIYLFYIFKKFFIFQFETSSNRNFPMEDSKFCKNVKKKVSIYLATRKILTTHHPSSNNPS